MTLNSRQKDYGHSVPKFITDAEKASFVDRMNELYDRLKGGKLPPKLILNEIQKLIEGDFRNQTKFGKLTLFGNSESTFFPHNQAEFDLIKEFFHPENEFMRIAQMGFSKEDEKNISDAFPIHGADLSAVYNLSPYKMPTGGMSVEEIISEAKKYNLWQPISMGHIFMMCHRHILGNYGKLSDTKDGNMIFTVDKDGFLWAFWVFNHHEGWSFRMEKLESTKIAFKEEIVYWLKSPDWQVKKP